MLSHKLRQLALQPLEAANTNQHQGLRENTGEVMSDPPTASPCYMSHCVNSRYLNTLAPHEHLWRTVTLRVWTAAFKVKTESCLSSLLWTSFMLLQALLPAYFCTWGLPRTLKILWASSVYCSSIKNIPMSFLRWFFTMKTEVGTITK